MTNRKNLDRRDALKLTLGASLVAATSGFTAKAQTSQNAPAAGTNGGGFYRTKVGDFTVVVLSDGQAAPGAALPNWGANPELQDQFAAALRENFIDPARYVNNFNPMLIDTGTQRVLIDTGRGGDAGRLLANMAAAGYRPADVTTVFLTHGHGDHIGGLASFPGARLVMGEAEFNFWATQAQPSAAVQKNLIANRARFTLLGENAEIVPGVTTVPAYGHTAGQFAVLVRSGDQQLMHLADAGGQSILSLRFPANYLGFDADKPTAVATRARLFDRASNDRLRVVGYHFPWPGIGYVRRREGGGYEFVPEYFLF
ncbi:MBL fold metallo-hydrolase [Deinococcus yavapaiensis]|uniref:Glyoxylase-like metal-dependent hydrolase (Beta-lactamase superfamily II) n=1 Tax=Deinococcus yavapaiensis KR-236 TaxID=694435 RepID=A0A318SK77_9DEIO|nr:MBL fold metallo-hydrolase [Deinococcus yavapaiensis]PYE52958.1 glyoxylase-like metal-dependent hydrolase (beta-lactamase superfamily II) [Deinococcus yavapaiensis KR-236]